MALDLFKDFATNVSAEEQGAWEEYGQGAEFLIGRANNKGYNKLLTRAFEKNKRLLDTKGDAAEAKAEELIVDVMSKTILLGWRGDFLWAGQRLEYTPENARTMLAVKDFRRWVSSKAEDFERFKLAQEEEDVGK